MWDVHTGVRVQALFRIGREVPGFTSASDFVWVAHAEMLGAGLIQVFYVSASTGKTLALFPEASTNRSSQRRPTDAAQRGSPQTLWCDTKSRK